MKKLDQERFEADLQGGSFLIGVEKGRCGLAETASVPVQPEWPEVILWVAAAARTNSPDRFFFRVNCEKYPSEPVTAMIWDPASKEMLVAAKRPKGSGQVPVMFRTDWEGGRALYHPFDRIAAKGHPDWGSKYPGLVWDPGRHTIVDLLNVIHELLFSQDYIGA